MFLIFITCFVAITNAHHSQEKMMRVKEHYQECINSTGVDIYHLINASKGEFSEDKKLMAYYFCAMLLLGFQDEDGTLQPKVMTATLPEDYVKEHGVHVIETCTNNKTVVSKELLAFNVVKCFGKDLRFFD